MAGSALFARLVDSSDRLFKPYTSPDERIVDVGAYPHVASSIRILAGAFSGSVYLQHAAVKEESAWINLVQYSLNVGQCPGVAHYDAFENTLRYLRARTTNGDYATSLSIDIVARP
jgi:hypothetical protein